MASMNVSVPDPMRDWVEQRIESGQYASASDYVRDLIQRDQVRADEHQALIAALIEGEKSGISKRRIPEILEGEGLKLKRLITPTPSLRAKRRNPASKQR